MNESAFTHPNTTFMKNIILNSLIIIMITSCAEHKMEAASDEFSNPNAYDLTAKENLMTSADSFSFSGEENVSIELSETPVTTSSPKISQSSATQSSPATSVYSHGKKIIKTANVRFQVNNVNETMRALEPIIIRFSSYVASSNLRLDHPNLENKMSIRVPNDHFDNFMKALDQQSIYMNLRNITTQDVSKEFVDLESRLRTKREVEQRYMEILRKKTGTIEEVLTAEEKIGYLHEEIEATIARINYLREQVSYSTINLEFYEILTEKINVEEEAPGFFQEAGTAMMTGLNGLKNITLALLNIWPVLILFVTVIYFLVRKRKVLTETVKS